MVDYLGNIKKPFSDIKTLIIGMILSLIPIVNLLVSGYALKVAEDTIKGKKALREFAINDIVEYIVKVVLSIVVGIVYMIIPLVLIGVGIGGALLGVASDITALSDPAMAVETFAGALGSGGIFLVIGGLLGLIAGIMLPMALMKWLKTGTLGAAFNVGDVIGSVLTADYIITLIVAFLYSIVVSAVAAAIAGLLAITVVLPLLVFALAGFVTNVTVMSMYAETV
jgi:hypothetical protein